MSYRFARTFSDPTTQRPEPPPLPGLATVWVVFHNDIEDSKWVRGVFTTRELAEACRDSVELDRYGDGYGNDHFTANGTRPSICCDLEEWDIDGKRIQNIRS